MGQIDLWKITVSLQDRLGKAAAVLYVAVGLGLARGCLAWVFNMVRFSEVGSSCATTAQYVVGMGEATMFFLLAAYARRRVLLRTSPAVYALPFTVLPLGAVLIAAAPGMQPDASAAVPVFLAGCAVAAMGYAGLLTLWFEQMATLPPRQALCSFGLAYFVNITLWLICGQMTVLLSTITCILASVVAAALLVGAQGVTPSHDVPAQPLPARVISVRLLLWIVVLALAFGVGEGRTAMGYATVYAKVGMGLPELLVLLGLMLPFKRFDVGVFCRLTTVLVAAGLVGVFFSDHLHGVAQVLLSSSVESLQMFAIMVAYFTARQHRASAACYGALVMGLFTLCVRLGQIVQHAVPDGMSLVYILLLITVVGMSIALLRENRFDSQLHLDRAPRPDEGFYRELADRQGLSKREESVFLLLIQGSSYDQIGEELFMAPSTVRAHASRIFKKFGVHTRQELDAMAATVPEMQFPHL